MFHKKRQRFEIGGWTAERVLEGGKVVDVDGHHRVSPTTLKKARHVFGGHRVARLRPPILAGIAEIWNHRGYPLRTGILQRADEKKEPAELVVRALLGITVERVDDKRILAAHLDERPDLVLAILETAFLVCAEDLVEASRDALAVIPRAFDRK